MAVQDYQLLLKVSADLQDAINGLKGLQGSLGDAKGSADQLGESADEATARIKAMVAATSEQVQVEESARSQAERAAQTANTTIKSYDDQAAAMQRAGKAAQEYRSASTGTSTGGVGGTAAVAGLEAERAAMAKLAGQIDPTVAALAKLDAQEVALNALRSKGVVGVEDYTAYKAVIDDNRASLTKAAGAAEQFAFASAGAKREYGVLAGELARGNTARLEGSLVTLANRTGFLTALFSPLGLAILAVGGAVGAFAIAVEKADEDERKLNDAIQLTGNYAGQTAAGLGKMASSITEANGSLSDSRTILATLVSSGKVGSASLQSLGQAAVDMAKLTGESADKAAEAVLKMFDGTAAGALKADEQYHFLTTDIYDQIKAYEEEGNAQAAMDTAAQAFHEAALTRIADETAQLRGLSKAWDTVKKSVASGWETFKAQAALATGGGSDQQQIDDLLTRKQNATPGANGRLGFAGVINNVLGQGFGPDEQKQLDDLQAKVKAASDAAAQVGQQKVDTSAAVKADADVDKLAASVDKLDEKSIALKRLKSDFDELWKAADPSNAKLQGVQQFIAADGTVSYGGGQYDKLTADIYKKYDAKPKKPKSTVGVDNAAVTAQADLVKMLGDEQGAVDPVAKVWATYNDTVTKANELAAKAVKGKGANVQAINAERDAVIAVAAKVRDAALDKQADKDREAFEKLRDSLSGLSGLSFSSMNKQLDELNKYLKEGTISAKEYADTAGKILDQNTPKLPEFKGADALTTGPFGELAKLDDQTKQLQDAYTKQLAALNDWHEKTLDSDQAFIAKENALYGKRNDEQQKIDDARQQVMLTGITSSLASAAEALKSGFGVQSNIYRAAFAVSKAAAIAQATINLYTDVSKASAMGWPQNIPLIVKALSDGETIIAEIGSISAGFSGGGYTGDGPKMQPAGVVHAGEFVNRQEVVSQNGARAFLEDFNNRGMAAVRDRNFPGYADGGFVDSAAASLSGFPAANDSINSTAIAGMPARSAQGGAGSGNIRIVNAAHTDLVKDWANSSEGETTIMNIIGRNKTTIKSFAR